MDDTETACVLGNFASCRIFSLFSRQSLCSLSFEIGADELCLTAQGINTNQVQRYDQFSGGIPMSSRVPHPVLISLCHANHSGSDSDRSWHPETNRGLTFRAVYQFGSRSDGIEFIHDSLLLKHLAFGFRKIRKLSAIFMSFIGIKNVPGCYAKED